MLEALGSLAAALWTAFRPGTVLLGAVVFLLLSDLLKRQRPKNYPPGPPRLPFVGNFFQLDFEQGHLSLQRILLMIPAASQSSSLGSYLRRAWQSTLELLPEESYGQRNLAAYSPWGPTESDRTEATWQARWQELLGTLLVTSFHFFIIISHQGSLIVAILNSLIFPPT